VVIADQNLRLIGVKAKWQGGEKGKRERQATDRGRAHAETWRRWGGGESPPRWKVFNDEF